ncbi:hypothetical protein QP157_11730 [Sphingomonas sp. LR61]
MPSPQRGDEHDVGGQVERHHLLARVAVVQVRDRLVADDPEVAVDAADAQLDLVAERGVGVHALAARARDLDEGGVLDLDAAVLDELAEGLDAVSDALGVVEAVDPEQHRLRVAEALADLAGTLLHLGTARDVLEGLGVDRDREVPGLDVADRDPLAAARCIRVVDRDVDRLALRRVALDVTDRAEEVARVVVALEADDVGAEQAVQDLRAPGQLGVDADRRERDVVEEADRQVGTLGPGSAGTSCSW